MASPHLNAARRAAELERLSDGEALDVVVIGGGITGCGVALDAASRGLSVALLERRDLAHGTSRWSSKLVHGGLRYLAQGQFGVAAESARERNVLMTRTAPHLCRPLASVIPLTDRISHRASALAKTGYRMGDLLRIGAGTSRKELPPPRRVAAPEARALVPALRADGVRGAIVGWDGQLEDDARLVVAVARTAAAHGALILTRCAAESVERGRVHARDELTGTTLEIAARHVISATGVWASELAPSVRLRPSKGAHVIIPAARLGHPRGALTVPAEGENAKWVFALPLSDERVAIGLTDEPLDGPIPDEPAVDDADQRFLLDTLSTALDVPLTADDVIGGYAGVRPLLDQGEGATVDLSRRHSVIEDPGSGLVTIVGGKLTTYRRMAQDAVDYLAERPGLEAGACRTARLPLVGTPPRRSPADAAAAAVPDRLVRRYGAEAPAVAALADGAPELLEPVADGVPVLGVELAFAVRSELALTADDLLDRRTRLGLVPAQRARALAAARAAIPAAPIAT
ncbi:MAG: glycerol-3-phosphate dehydrogenase/oxidase [Solirubrobacteraceae bacterium]